MQIKSEKLVHTVHIVYIFNVAESSHRGVIRYQYTNVINLLFEVTHL